jgi:CBS domain-containing protein
MTTPTMSPTVQHPLESLRARDLMSVNPISLDAEATMAEAAQLLRQRGFSAAPVIDAAGRPIGVVSRTDLLILNRELVPPVCVEDDSGWDMSPESTVWAGFSSGVTGETPVKEVMTPSVLTIAPDAPARKVARRMLDSKVHQLFVADEDGALVGVISALDILRHL